MSEIGHRLYSFGYYLHFKPCYIYNIFDIHMICSIILIGVKYF